MEGGRDGGSALHNLQKCTWIMRVHSQCTLIMVVHWDPEQYMATSNCFLFTFNPRMTCYNSSRNFSKLTLATEKPSVWYSSLYTYIVGLHAHEYCVCQVFMSVCMSLCTYACVCTSAPMHVLVHRLQAKIECLDASTHK